MRPKRKAKPITIRLFIAEMERVERVFERFSSRYPFSKLDHMIRLWLNLPVEDPTAALFDAERDYLTGKTLTLKLDGKKRMA